MSTNYLPIALSNNNCVIWYDNDTLRVYDSIPVANSSVSYTDYFVNTHYATRPGTEITDSNFVPYICLDNSKFTNNIWYRNDISDICITFACIFFVSIVLIAFICKSFFRGLFK